MSVRFPIGIIGLYTFNQCLHVKLSMHIHCSDYFLISLVLFNAFSLYEYVLSIGIYVLIMLCKFNKLGKVFDNKIKTILSTYILKLVYTYLQKKKKIK